MRNKAMERLGEKKKRAGDDQPWKKRKHTPNETMDYLREATEKECGLKKEELEFILEGNKKKGHWHNKT